MSIQLINVNNDDPVIPLESVKAECIYINKEIVSIDFSHCNC